MRGAMVVEEELSGLNHELSMFPERAFEFRNAGTVVIEQVVKRVLYFACLSLRECQILI